MAIRSSAARPRSSSCMALLVGAFLSLTAVPAFGEKPTVEFRFAYLPSYDTIRLFIGSAPKEAAQWKVTLTAQHGQRALAETSGMFPFNASGQTWIVPKLPAGSYKLVCTILGAAQPIVIERSFDREALPWEKSGLGTDPTVIVPPFTPLTVDEVQRKVGCILRNHHLATTGLWDQVTSQDIELLAAPIALRVEAEGKTHVASGTALSFTARQPHQVAATAGWSAGPLKGATRLQFDYDGMMKVGIEIEPCATRIERMTLAIPMKSDEAWLMHPVTDLLRHHYAGRVPDGDGRVWDSLKIPRYKLPGPFVPYIWVGGPERGICWFADNDKDWITDAAKPAMEIVREGKTVTLLVHFITRPSVIMRKRTIEFGLMATPAKPMPETPRNWRTWWTEPTVPAIAGVHFQLVGACYYWGSPTPCLQYYPAFENFTIYDEFVRVRKTGKIDPDYIESKWLPQFDKVPQVDDAARKNYTAHINWTFNTMRGCWTRKQADPASLSYIIPYTNARAIVWDASARTYTDEWTIFDVADPRWGKSMRRFLREKSDEYNLLSGWAYEVDPVETYADMATWYIQKMLQTFADGVYLDDVFFHANYNPVPGPGYIDDDGKLHAGVSFFAFRKFVKRLAIMQHQMGQRPMIYLHMTNTNLVPILSLGTINLDWEWRDQGPMVTKDLQDRLDVDKDTSLILAQSTGLQSGNVPVSIDRFMVPKDSPASRAWLLRTQAAVCIPHEIRPSGHDPAIQKVINAMMEFGYGQPDCRVYRYWEKPLPIVTEGARVKALLLVRGKKAMIFLGSFGEGGDCTVQFDCQVLGLNPDAAVHDAESGNDLGRTENGRFTLPIRKHDFRVVTLD